MSAWWAARTARERVILALGAAALALLLVAQLTIMPLIKWRGDIEARAGAAEERYKIVARSAALATPVKTEGTEPVRNVLNTVAGALQVELTFVNALPDGSVDLQAGPLPPDKVFTLLSRLEREHGIKVKSADIARASEDASKVRVQATVAR